MTTNRRLRPLPPALNPRIDIPAFAESRNADFARIQTCVEHRTLFGSESALVYNADALSILKQIPDGSVSLILTDPPYHSTKKANIKGDKDFKKDDDFIKWLSLYFEEWRRILKPNGSIYCFCSSEMAARIEVEMSKSFNVLAHVVWTKPNEPGFDGWKQKMRKESLRQWYSHSERALFAEPASEGNLHRSYFGNLLRVLRKKAGLSGHQLTEMIGEYGEVNHGGAVSNWETGRNIPSREQYQKIGNALCSTGKIDNLPLYEDVIRPFTMDSSREFTDIWNFPSVKPYKGKHPAEKPVAMFEHAIYASTYECDIVLDCFAGSGNVAIAALNLNRKVVCIELDANHAVNIASKLTALADPLSALR